MRIALSAPCWVALGLPAPEGAAGPPGAAHQAGLPPLGAPPGTGSVELPIGFVAVLAGEVSEQSCGLGAVLAQRLQIGSGQLGDWRPRIAFRAAIDGCQPVGDLPVSPQDPLPRECHERAPAAAAEPRENLRRPARLPPASRLTA